MSFAPPTRKERRRKALASLPGQRTLAGGIRPTPRLKAKIPPEVHTLFLGLGPGLDSAIKGHYFPGSNNYFWKLLHRSGIWAIPISAQEDDQILAAGFGLADVIERPTHGSVVATRSEFLEARARVRKLVFEHKPRLVVFVGKGAYRTFLRRSTAKVEYGLQTEKIEGAAVFLLPSTSGASAGVTSYAEKLEWFKTLKEFLSRTPE